MHPDQLINAAGSNGRCNTIQCIDSTMLPAGEQSVWLYSVKTQPGQHFGWSGLVSDFGFCFQCVVGSSLVLRRPIETTALIVHVDSSDFRLRDISGVELRLPTIFAPLYWEEIETSATNRSMARGSRNTWKAAFCAYLEIASPRIGRL